MKQYVIDELRPPDYEKLKSYLEEHFSSSAFDGIYWISLDEKLLSDDQAAHTDCQPFFFAMELDQNRLACELLVRTKNRMHCSCMEYATEIQRNWFIGLVDTILDTLEIKI